jgi:cytochrome c
MRRLQVLAGAALVGAAASVAPPAATAATGDAGLGARVFRVCAACHSLEPGRNLTGPSLAGLLGRKAGSLPSFTRYSPALRGSDIVWDEKTLDTWLKDPARDVPGNRMTFPGIRDDAARADLLAFLEQATKPGAAPPAAAQGGGMMGGGMMGGMGQGGMSGMMGGAQQAANLKQLKPQDQVSSITYCRDSYTVATADGEQRVFWERNLRFKTVDQAGLLTGSIRRSEALARYPFATSWSSLCRFDRGSPPRGVTAPLITVL